MLHSELLEHPNIRHGFFTRTGGISRGIYTSLNCGPGSGDNPDHITENRRRVAERLAGHAVPLCSLYQVHGSDVVSVTEPWDNQSRPKADAMVTDRPGIALGILTADCTPILFSDPEAGVVGAAHAGWKGAFGGIVSSTVAAMEDLGARRDRIKAVIGPTIAKPSYEVSAEFRNAFLTYNLNYEKYFDVTREGSHAQFDLPQFVSDRLQEEGIAAIADLKLDTYSDSRQFFSFRRTTHQNATDYGRQISAIMIRMD